MTSVMTIMKFVKSPRLQACSLVLRAPAIALAQERGGWHLRATSICANIADAAADARFALQKQALADMEKEIEGRSRSLKPSAPSMRNGCAAAMRFWRRRTRRSLLIYSRMRPDAAALQLTNMDEEIAAAVIAKLNPRVASAVLNEMEPGTGGAARQCHHRRSQAGQECCEAKLKNLIVIVGLCFLAACATRPEDLGREPAHDARRLGSRG